MAERNPPLQPNGSPTAIEIARALGARAVGDGWMARCPAHNDKTPSLSITSAQNGKPLIFCHAGCAQAEVISSLRRLGLWTGKRRWAIRPTSNVANGDAQADEQRSTSALAIWESAVAPESTPVETYLRHRQLRLPEGDCLRCSPKLKHPSDDWFPAMVALVTNGATGEPTGVHRTYLAPDGSGKADVPNAKLMLGPCRGGVVRLAKATTSLLVAEGIETCLSVMQQTGEPGWAALSTSGLRALELPPAVRDVTVLADGDDAGEAAAQACASRWATEGRRVRIARPPRGLDFNDLLMGAHKPGRRKP